MATEPTADNPDTEASTSAIEPTATSIRHHALDQVRAVAMLLGVVYHSILFRMFVGAGGPPGPMAVADGSRWLSDWLHNFRMPLFFLISGFFGRMMLQKYGMRDYLRKRWRRIAVPLFVGIFSFSPLYIIAREMVGGPGPGGFGAGPPPGMTGPPPGMASFGRPPIRPRPPGPLPSVEGPGGFQPPPGGPMPGPFGVTEVRLSDRLFGGFSHYFDLHHLWFLWYLLVFATVAPGVARVAAALLSRSEVGALDRIGKNIVRWGLAPILFGLMAGPTLMLSPGPFGWSLGLSPSIFRGFPDFLLHLDREMMFYFLFFLWGWWLHREREALPALGQTWLPSLLMGLIAFATSTALSNAYASRPDLPGYAGIRVCGYTLYGLASALISAGFLGAFLRYLDRTSRAWRYLADTALWVYLIHQPLVVIGLALFQPLHLVWWARTAAVSLLATATALLLYEAVVRPTPLVRLFGPASPGRAAETPRLISTNRSPEIEPAARP